MTLPFTRTLGRSGIQVSPLGMGCWAIGGPFWRGDVPVGWGNVDDSESLRAILRRHHVKRGGFEIVAADLDDFRFVIDEEDFRGHKTFFTTK